MSGLHLCRLLLTLGLALDLTGCSGAATGTPIELPRPAASVVAPVDPPRQPRANSEHASDEELARLGRRAQPKALSEALLALEQGSIEERIAKLRTKVVADLVFVKGGSFMMGDFAALWAPDGTRYTYNNDDKPPREITLSDYWIGKYKTSYAEFDVFTDATGRPRTGMEFGAENRDPLFPAGAYWQDAKDYCLWLGEITGIPFDLPTEAQWEYAARSRGKFFAVATDDGNIERGRNFPYFEQRFYPRGSGGSFYPIGIFPPNPLGLHDMAHGGLEWVNDWYAKDAYTNGSPTDPRGPESGVERVVRGWGRDSIKAGSTVWRRHFYPEMEFKDAHDADTQSDRLSTSYSPNVRCVSNVPR